MASKNRFSRASSVDMFNEFDECDSIDSSFSCNSSNCSFEFTVEQQRYKVLTSDDVLSQMNAEIDSVSVMLNVSFKTRL